MRPQRAARAADPRNTTSLVAALVEVCERDEDPDGGVLGILWARGGAAELAVGVELTKSTDPRRRELGADLLGQLGWDDRTQLTESVPVLVALLADPIPGVVAAAAVALGHRNHADAIIHLLPLTAHPDPTVRYGVAHGLSRHDDARAVEALIGLSEDADRDVRNWATFGLGALTAVDTVALRDALARRAADPDPEIRGEAVVGLAVRGDARALPLVQQELLGELAGNWAVEAAGALGHPGLVAALDACAERIGPEDAPGWLPAIARARAACLQRR